MWQGIHEDEKCWSLHERDQFILNDTLLVRMQTIRVVRDGNLVEFSRAMGPAEDFAGCEWFTIMGLLEDTVGTALTMAEELRYDTGLSKAMDDHLSEGNVIDLAIRSAEQVQQYMKDNWRTVASIASHGRSHG